MQGDGAEKGDAVDVSEVDLAGEEKEGTKKETEEDGAC